MSSNFQTTKSVVRHSSIAFEMLAIIGLFTFAGWKLDQWLKNEFPVFLLILSLLGVFFGIYTAIKDFLKVEKNKKIKHNS
jgi:F0F1-type ATP synthase assembly protein I